MESSRRSIFGSLKSSLSRGKQSSSSSPQQQAQQQAKYVAQPTRRPGEQGRFPSRTNNPLTQGTAAPSSNPFHSASSFDAPPAYSEAPNAAPQPSPVRENAAPAADDAYSFLDKFDTVFLIDDSGSMAGGLWRQTADALMTITPICTAHDADGIDIHFLNHERPYPNITSPTEVQEIFQTVKPGGGTPTGLKLQELFDKYFESYQPKVTKPMNIICITDGAPGDDDESPLIDAARELDRLKAPAWQLGVQFFQVGSDPEATEHLQMLDDKLPELANDKNLRDIVDTVPFLSENGTVLSGAGILKVVLGAVTRRLDRQSKRLHT
jgi:Mg-chelatase subunit ChlD